MRWLVSVASLAASPAIVSAQPAPQPDSALRRRAASITVGDYCSVARQIVSDTMVIRALGADSSDARSSAALICNPLLSSFSLLALRGLAPAPIEAVARLQTNVYSAAQQGILDAMSEFRADVRTPGMTAVLRTALGRERDSAFVVIAETAHGLVVAEARDQALDRLANYERKLGPTSARLNFPEVLLNYAAQRWVPGFKATPLGGPSPLEVVASYVPGYVTFVDGSGTPIPVSAAEFGLRYYLFGKHFGKPGIAGVFLPSYLAAGMLTASNDNGALVWPWKGQDRSGGYFSWGSIKVGYIKRSGGSWLLSKQFQIVPFVF
jgi:hypothetical protein